MFSKILIANRGEIAVRIIRACKEMGITTVAVFSEADRDALHVSLADESYCIGPAQVGQSYLNMEAILSAAVVSGAEAIHPGYGLLSENARFATLCQQCNITFIGPTGEMIEKMGDKDEARRTMKQAGVPVVPGSDIVESVDEALRLGAQIGYPLLVKARSGGGGRGIRRVDSEAEIERAFLAATAEAQSAFGDGAVYMEKFLFPVKHIEVQLLCDAHGQVVCLGERECSMQRKNQKLLEESPSVAVSPKMREEMMAASAKAAKAIGYRGLGTIEFLLSQDGHFYFMEMNTRLQVEHPVTEMVTGIDLVKWQIRVAAGLELDFTQKDVTLNGHAIECRINAEDPYHDFRPSCGQITMLHIPGGPWVRFDTALYQGYTIPPFYDSMVGKLIVHAPTREEAIRKMQAALCEVVVEGIENNRELQLDLISDERFGDGSYTTDFLAERG
ncbi:acetyl-CoA carboxylase biotin carboxylase subunit [Christensenellaceae bacterium NSJ-44]|uniref:Biotin carboxylase n=1 Tax=Luoshenia tenuis TaxID=2763654 RepID=A0A926HL12_9FIRM|nr:acetyl-CoA carboxylase biotin carboxylase subunit [Luoshenia tenuis]MBC8528004.1 acetyl-CoA carboxylase biotin carboxylase subunit [Luoshenia tenuis]